MKVVILHQHFKTPYTGGAIRSWYLATALVQRGIETIVITAHNEDSHARKIIDGIEVHYLPVKYDNKFGFAARSLSFVRFTHQSAKLANTISGVTLCYAISVPLTVGIAAMRWKEKSGVPFVFEVGDLWPDAPVQLGFLKNYFLRRYFYRLEKEIYEQASAVVALSPAIRDAVEKKAPGKETWVIPNIADCEFYNPGTKPAARKKFGVEGKFVVSCIGAVGFANGLDYFLACAQNCSDLPAVHFILCGEGAMLEGLKSQAKELGLLNLSFVTFQDRNGVRDLLNATDAAFVSFRNAPILETGSPNKFFDGLAAGKLMIVNFSGWIRQEIEENQCGFYCRPDHPEDFANKIKPFLVDSVRLNKYQQAARRLAESRYSRTLLSEEFVNHIEAFSAS